MEEETIDRGAAGGATLRTKYMRVNQLIGLALALSVACILSGAQPPESAAGNDERLVKVEVEPNSTTLLAFEPLDLMVTVQNTSTVSVVELVGSWDIFVEYKHESTPTRGWKSYHADKTPAASPVAPTRLRLSPGESKRYFVSVAYDNPGDHVFEQPDFHQIKVHYGKLESDVVRIKVESQTSEAELQILKTSQIPRFFSIESSRVVAVNDTEEQIRTYVSRFPNSPYLRLVKIAQGIIKLKRAEPENLRVAAEVFREVATGAEDRYRTRAREYLAYCCEKLGDTAGYQETLKELRDQSANPVARERAALKLEQMR
jgi:hypothetical protein